MRKKEEEEEKAFYEARGIKLKPEYQTAEPSSAKKQKTDEGSKTAKDAAGSKAREELCKHICSGASDYFLRTIMT